MNAREKTAGLDPIASAAGRVEDIDWERVSNDLDARGCAMIERLLSAAECDALTALYQQNDRFRSRVLMERHGYGRGEYKYFAYPLPELVADLRSELYPHLA